MPENEPSPAINQPIVSAPPDRLPAPDRSIDLQALAEKIYELLKREACIERERLGKK